MHRLVSIGNIGVDPTLYEFVNREVLPGASLGERAFWDGFAGLVTRLAPANAQLLARRDELQARIDRWHRDRPGALFDGDAYIAFLREIGYLAAACDEFAIDTDGVDAEIASIAAPQLVVPVNNARYALNAANARWGSLYDALYGSDVIDAADGAERGPGYNPVRGARVIGYARQFLDEYFPLAGASHSDAVGYRIDAAGLAVLLPADGIARLRDPTAFQGYQGQTAAPQLVLLVHHGLHVEIHIDRSHEIGRADRAGVSDVVLEAALSTIQDFEDSVAAVDVAEKLAVYRNWLGLMNGTLTADIIKGGKSHQRRLNADRRYRTAAGAEYSLPGRSLLLARNVGAHVQTDAVRLDGEAIPESLLDAVVTALIGKHDLAAGCDPGRPRNSRHGSIYIVKPKMHGPEEVAFADRLFAQVEDLVLLPRHTLKIGIMDEERRTTVNLAQCIHAARHRVVFINTGFLDRTGDEIHTSMEAAAVPRKGELKQAIWLDAYERQNVDIGLAAGFRGRAQIGKGMWAMPDLMAEMVRTKIAHPRAGANTAWVPSPTAATLHALHYHAVDVAGVQAALATRPPARLADILTPPLTAAANWTVAEIEAELNNNAQSILGYVVRWIDFGVGCSKVPDYANVALMEDRATLRISSQHMANWLHHGVCTPAQVRDALMRMALIVDRQNASDPAYRPMSVDPERNVAFQAACELVFSGRLQPNGYTEAILHRRRRERKLAV